jgi:hypothetical protein
MSEYTGFLSSGDGGHTMVIGNDQSAVMEITGAACAPLAEATMANIDHYVEMLVDRGCEVVVLGA